MKIEVSIEPEMVELDNAAKVLYKALQLITQDEKPGPFPEHCGISFGGAGNNTVVRLSGYVRFRNLLYRVNITKQKTTTNEEV